MKSICWTNECPARNLLTIGDAHGRTRRLPYGTTTCLEIIMALSLSGERSLAAATPARPFAAIARWIAQANAARTRRVALMALLELDHARLYDLGISRADITAALAHKGRTASMVLNTARARNARR